MRIDHKPENVLGNGNRAYTYLPHEVGLVTTQLLIFISEARTLKSRHRRLLNRVGELLKASCLTIYTH